MLNNVKEALAYLCHSGHSVDVEYLLNYCKRYMQAKVKADYLDSDESLKQMKKACACICRLNTSYKKETGGAFLTKKIALSSKEECELLIKEFVKEII